MTSHEPFVQSHLHKNFTLAPALRNTSHLLQRCETLHTYSSVAFLSRSSSPFFFLENPYLACPESSAVDAECQYCIVQLDAFTRHAISLTLGMASRALSLNEDDVRIVSRSFVRFLSDAAPVCFLLTMASRGAITLFATALILNCCVVGS